MASGDPDIDHERELREQWQRLHMEMNVTMDKARDIAGADINRRLEGMNELRTQINSERGLYATNKDIDPVKAYISGQTGRGLGMNALFGWALGALMAAKWIIGRKGVYEYAEVFDEILSQGGEA